MFRFHNLKIGLRLFLSLYFKFFLWGTNWKFNCKEESSTIPSGEHAHPKGKSRNNVHLGSKIDINTCPLSGAGVNRVSVRLEKEPEPTGQRAIVARLLSPFEDRHSLGLIFHVTIELLQVTIRPLTHHIEPNSLRTSW